MKNLLLLIVGAMCIVSCGDNKIEAFARQKCHEKGVMDEDIESIKAEKTDSMLSDMSITLNQIAMSRGYAECMAGKISRKQFQKLFDEDIDKTTDISYSLQFGDIDIGVVNYTINVIL